MVGKLSFPGAMQIFASRYAVEDTDIGENMVEPEPVFRPCAVPCVLGDFGINGSLNIKKSAFPKSSKRSEATKGVRQVQDR